ncbi:MAG: protease modulator HflC [Candidatus Bipolaricaulia bacterium]
MRTLLVFVVIVVLGLVAFNQFTFRVDETKVAAVLRFGKIERIVTEPGLHFKQPFVQNVEFYDSRLQTYNIKPKEIITQDQRKLVVDNYALWRVENPRKFRETVNGSFSTAQLRIDNIVFSNLRNILADNTLDDIVSQKRQGYMKTITQNSANQLSSLGVKVLDVRIRRADLPQANEQAVYNRMKSERQQKASQLRAEGREEATRIRAEADRKATVIKSEAKRKAQEIRGRADAEALRIYAETYSQDPDFYRFWRTLESYSNTFAKGNGSRIVLSTDSEYLRLFNLSELKSIMDELGDGSQQASKN